MLKKVSLIVMIVLILSASLAFGQEQAQTVVLKVEGMAWPFCSLAVESVLKRAEGVIEARASFIRGEAVIKYNPEKVTPKGLVDLINRRTFYRASLPEGQISARKDDLSYAQIELLGIKIPLQANLVLREIGMAFKGIEGIYDFALLGDGKGEITYDQKIISIPNIKKIALEAISNLDLKDMLPIEGIEIKVMWTFRSKK